MKPHMHCEMQNKLSSTRGSPLGSMGKIISSWCPTTLPANAKRERKKYCQNQIDTDKRGRGITKRGTEILPGQTKSYYFNGRKHFQRGTEILAEAENGDKLKK